MLYYSHSDNDTDTDDITNIVVCKYRRNVEFSKRINDGKNINVIVYDKENPLHIPRNKGNEASVFLKYIVDLGYIV